MKQGNKSKQYIREFEQYLHKRENMEAKKELKYVTVIHYKDLEFKLAFQWCETYYEDVYVSVGTVSMDYEAETICGLPKEFNDIEDLLIEAINEQAGQELEDECIEYELEHEQFLKSLYFN